SPEAEPKATRRGVGASPSSDFRLTNFAPASAFHAIGLGCSSNFALIFPEGDPKPTRRNSEQRWEKGRSWSGIGRIVVDYSLTQETHKIDYSATQGSPLLSPCYAQGRLKDCTRSTQQKKNFGQVEDAELPHGAELKQSVLGCFKTVCGVLGVRANTLIDSVELIAQRYLNRFSFVTDNKRTYRMVLTCLCLVFQSSKYFFEVLKSIRALALLALMVSMFSLSAQTPRKDSGADGLSQIRALKVGDEIPQLLWDTPLDVINNPNGQKTIKLSDYRNKRLIILDFWASWCGSCIESMEHVRSLEARYKDNTVFLKVNSLSSKDSHERIVKVFEKFKSRTNVELSKMEYIFRDSVLERFFAHVSIPHIVWIYDGKYIGSTYAQGLTSDAIDQVLHDKPLKD
ncbi:TlpA disulfide reductase family protein, partial [Sphingobacterium sp.]|uniref:TlpA family protein disulfide reductase n=1 Tax=Sphingobacterium sp. TaxID=341027 RepID=UPI0028A17333